ncbi:CheB methylesterase domain-containing protein [Pararhodobacter sp. CCB-MM2]|uniref:CheB methylesterase domain-containing protein n=1 Tax=Pararhodobacter sp. CCB-MM2 TaxID=1786003 RepID=UPI00082DD4A0|nr:CheB methylesterase domain-containing protein [Pararhodobacter sp. CCB-MM2]
MRLLVADPDRNRRNRVAQRLAALPGITITDLCADLTTTFNCVEHRPPTMVVLAQELSQRPEFEMMESLFRMLSVRWVFVGSARGPAMPGISATDAIIDLDGSDTELMAALRHQLVGASKPAPRAAAGLLQSLEPATSDRVVLIGSSTGGVDALLRILDSFPRDCPPTLIVQHTGAAYSAGLARLLDRNAAPEVREAVHGDKLRRGLVLLAPGAESHLLLDTRAGLACRLDPGEKLTGHRPSVDALFRSAVPIAKRVTAALLTGMGRDGAEGLLALRRAGARTIGQDKETSVVYGMPGHAARLGAVEKELPLSAIGPAILRVTQGVKA